MSGNDATELSTRLRQQQGLQEPSDAAAGPPVDDRDALERLYRRAAPGNLSNVDVILSKFSGRRDEMYRLLEKMFPDEIIERATRLRQSRTGGNSSSVGGEVPGSRRKKRRSSVVGAGL